MRSGLTPTRKQTGIGLNYQSIGSGGGIKQITEQDRDLRRVRHAAARRPSSTRSVCVQFPTVMGGIVPVVNLDGIKPGELTHRRPDARQDLSRRDQEVERSGDQEAQSDAKLPGPGDRGRAPFGRFGHDLHLHQLSLEGQRRSGSRKVGVNTSVEWPVGIGAKGNEGVANNVANTKGSIGYVEIRLRQAEQADLRPR